MYVNKPIKVTLLANEGILVELGGSKILIDGIHENNGKIFSGLSKHVLADLLEGQKPLFRNIEYVLFSHCHYDHFSAEYTEAFLKKHRIKGMFIPEQATRDYISLRETAMYKAESVWLLDIALGEKIIIGLSEEITVTVFRSVHAGEEYAAVENYCYLLDFCGRKLFIIADSENNVPYFSEMLKGEKIEAAFVNPLFLNQSAGREVITQAIKPERLIVYHIPFEDGDRTLFRKLVPRDIEKYRDSLPPVYILWNELQEVVL